jgi:Tol biopolymer transport system component
MNGDGSEQVNLTNNQADDTDPAFSQGGNQIAFRSNRDGDWKLFVMNADGANARVLSKNDGNDYWFWWSPDGQQIYIAYAIGPDPQNLTWKADLVQLGDGSTRSVPFGGSINWR